MPNDPLKQAQALLKLVERTAFVGVWTLHLEDQRLEWSDQLALLHDAAPGYVPAATRMYEHYAPEWRHEMQERVRACAMQGHPFDLEVQIVTLRGRRDWVRCVGQPLRGADGRIACVEGVVQEIAPHGYAHGTLLRHTVSMGGAMGSGEAVTTVDREGRLTYANEQAERLLARAARELIGRKLWGHFRKTARLRLEEAFGAAIAGRATLELEEMNVQGSHWLELRGYPFGGGLAVHLRDVTPRHREQEQLRLLEGSIARLNDIVIITEAGPFGAPGPRIVFVNEAFERRTGYTRDEVLGRTPRLLQGPGTDRGELDRIRAALEQWQRVRVDIVNYTKAGEPYWVDLDVSPVWDKLRRLTHWVAVGRDISERKVAEEKIQYLAFYDPLTELPNRQLLMDRLRDGLAAGRSGALMFIDLDNFKALNDTLGHQKGDLLLQQAAQRLRSCLAKGDTVGRLGGDEFVILLEDRSEKPIEPATAAALVSARVLARLGEPYELPGYVHHSTCSIGVTLFGAAPPSISELLKQADLAMYEAKAAGRNTVRFFDPEMQVLASANAALAADLRQAWHDGHLQIHYQPQVGAGGRMIGVEALLRWVHPQRGMVAPARFIPFAEESSLILPIGRWVLESACAQLAVWATRADRAHLSIAVNVSVRQFRHPDFVDEVTTAIRASGVRPDRIKLELTESLLADGIDVTIAKMGSLKDMGVQLSLDDFGIGYSALAYLKRLPLDQLKIDRSFVKDILTDANDAAIARTIIGLAQSLGLDVIAEGVETEAQRAFLAQQGCPQYQGYLFCKPLPLDALEAFMDARAAAPTPSAPTPSTPAPSAPVK
ncbi:EAL domain-containing protein [Ramlibacter sp.]|uniref:sensor domain-containing protein n=1 Tax=Ramlibacter sp. TaxID=1917967 RepID=UPI0025E8F3EE|nr:EAL domain-containing protein [Ramlibacter sp.]